MTSVAAIEAATDVIAMTYYDADAGKAIFGFMMNPDATSIVDDNTTFNEIGSASMTIASYNALAATNFSLQA